MSVTTDVRYHGSGKKTVTHRLPTPAGEIEVNVLFTPGREDPNVWVNTYHNGEGPNTHVRIDHDRILDGWDGHHDD